MTSQTSTDKAKRRDSRRHPPLFRQYNMPITTTTTTNNNNIIINNPIPTHNSTPKHKTSVGKGDNQT